MDGWTGTRNASAFEEVKQIMSRRFLRKKVFFSHVPHGSELRDTGKWNRRRKKESLWSGVSVTLCTIFESVWISFFSRATRLFRNNCGCSFLWIKSASYVMVVPYLSPRAWRWTECKLKRPQWPQLLRFGHNQNWGGWWSKGPKDKVDVKEKKNKKMVRAISQGLLALTTINQLVLRCWQ